VKDPQEERSRRRITMADTTPSRQRMERGDNDPQPSGRPSNPRQYGKEKPFYYKNKNYNGQQKNSNSYTSPATMKFALQAAACWLDT
jgi:hypothetical protein